MKTTEQLLQLIAAGKTPPVILVGGDHDFSSERALHAIREAILASDPGMQLETFNEGADLGVVLDSFRTMSLFGGPRLLLLPEVNAFVTKKELAKILEKASSDWNGAKTDRKRSSSVAKLLHALGLIGLDLESTDSEIASALGAKKGDATLLEMLEFARRAGRKATRGEGDAALLSEAIAHGGAPGAVLLMRTGEVPKDSATVGLIDKAGAVVVCNLSREGVSDLINEELAAIAQEFKVRFEPRAVTLLRERMGIERVLSDKWSKEVPDVRLLMSEAERLATFVGENGKVTAAVVEQQIASVAGGARYEFASLFSERKPVEALAKLRDLVAQARREDSKTPAEIHYGRYLFALAEELRQLLGVISFARARKIDLRQSVPYNRFKDLLADPLGEYLVVHGLARQKPHPFPLQKKFEAARHYTEKALVEALAQVAELEYQRKSGGTSAEIGLETLLFSAQPRPRA